ncbi:MAG: MCE family protein [Fibrobacter sp.]|nr:MCE family protein [Fibrobacter sp.]
MNRFSRLLKRNVLPLIIFLILVAACGMAWYVYHPSSPYHKKYSFVVSFEAIGTLSPGNRVNIRGIPKGEITKIELTDDAVYVTARVLAEVKIPDNSEVRLINSGLMGEREMCVLTGDSKKLVQPGDTMMGIFDEGTTGLAKNLKLALKDLDEIRDSMGAFIDTVTVGDLGKRIQRVIRKGKNTVYTARDDIKLWIADIDTLLVTVDQFLDKNKTVLEGTVERGGGKVDVVKGLISRTDLLIQRLVELKQSSMELYELYCKKESDVRLFVKDNEKLNAELEKLIVDLDALIADIKKNGVKLNADFF